MPHIYLSPSQTSKITTVGKRITSFLRSFGISPWSFFSFFVGVYFLVSQFSCGTLLWECWPHLKGEPWHLFINRLVFGPFLLINSLLILLYDFAIHILLSSGLFSWEGENPFAHFFLNILLLISTILFAGPPIVFGVKGLREVFDGKIHLNFLSILLSSLGILAGCIFIILLV